MEEARFLFLEILKTLGLAFLSLLAVKAVAGLKAAASGRESWRGVFGRGILYAGILALTARGAWNIGQDVAAEVYYWASGNDLARGQIPTAYAKALRAVRLRPGVLRYWQILAASKFASQQCTSLLADLAAFRALTRDALEEEDSYRFAVCYYLDGQYDKTLSITQRLILENRYYAAPYVVQGMAYAALKKYPEAEKSFLGVLQMFPSQQAAVEGLAHVYFLTGNRAAALGVLSGTAKYPFPPEARKRFEALKALYAQ